MVRWTIFMRYAMTSDRRRLLIAVTPEDICHGESGIVAGILDAGFDYVHLRHPAASLAEVKAVIEDIPPPAASQAASARPLRTGPRIQSRRTASQSSLSFAAMRLSGSGEPFVSFGC